MPEALKANRAMPILHTTLGPYHALPGMILPHEHLFVDLGPIEAASYQTARTEQVLPVMLPHIQAIQAQGIVALVECTPVGVGRRVDIVKALSQAANFPVVVATGIYREPWVPAWAHQASEEELTAWMVAELTDQIEQSGVKAAWIKLSAGDDGITTCEAKILRAAARAGVATNALIGSHTIRGRVVRTQLNILEEAGYRADRFLWIHTQAEDDFALHLEMARRGCWIEYDSLGSPDSEQTHLDRIQRLIDAGLHHRLLLSHDRGWYDPSKPNGGEQLPFTYLHERFLPALRQIGIEEGVIAQLVCVNPFTAFAR